MAQDNGTNGAIEGSDAQTPDRFYIVVTMSEGFKKALTDFADGKDMAVAQVAREAIAKAIGYDITLEPKTARRSKYTTEDEKKAAHAVASLKAALLRRLLVAQHNMRSKGNKDALAKVEDILNRMDATGADYAALNTELNAALGVKPREPKAS